MFLCGARAIPQEGDNQCVHVLLVCTIEGCIFSDLSNERREGLLHILAVLDLDDRMQRRQVEINARILLPYRLEIHFVGNVVKNRSEQDIEKVLDVVFVHNQPAVFLGSYCHNGDVRSLWCSTDENNIKKNKKAAKTTEYRKENKQILVDLNKHVKKKEQRDCQ